MTGGHEHWPIRAVWTALVLATLAGFAGGEGLVGAHLAATAAILLAALKIDLVIAGYMEVRWSHRPLRPFLAAWLVAVTAIFLGGYWTA